MSAKSPGVGLRRAQGRKYAYPMPDIDILHLAKLAQLSLSKQEMSDVHADLTRIIGMVDLMQSVDTEAVEPLANPLDGELRLRPDEVTECADRDALQAGAPSVQDGLYLVPKVIE